MLHDLYEVIDSRSDLPPGKKIAPIALLENQPDALHVWEFTGKSKVLPLTDENYDWKNEILTVYTDDGMVSFVPLSPDSDVFAFVSTPFDGLVQDCLR